MSGYTFYEFFAGGGMVRAGLGPSWRCTFANDLSPKKAASYRANWGGDELQVGDVHDVRADQLPGRADLAWGSFPCQDLSLAGRGAGLAGTRSGAYWGFMALVGRLRAEGRPPRILALENVCGALSSRGGGDFAAIGRALSEAGYRFGALVIDAALFVPQSRPRLFIVAVDRDEADAPAITTAGPDPRWHSKALLAAVARLDAQTRTDWLWWRLPPPCANALRLEDLIEDPPVGVRWHGQDETAALVALMSPLHQERLAALKRSGARRIGTIYKRIRPDGAGGKRQAAEARFDGRAGCLRTPAGGSSRQTLVAIENGAARTRLLSPREAVRLMGLSDDYILPARYNDAYRLAGDGVVAPVVRFLANNLFEPLLHAEGAARARERLAG
ncbi:DNA cytosine methyltransferase [Hansschlegelia sp. KR7-227]|uniref:DNA cytosine methyltransferase n=1 Tax=Hansschlegelia sp. KR7-227 TaxID=3400914 RepID=UPI003C09C1C7